MNVLVVGGGGREHALVHALAHSSSVRAIDCAPGNAGVESHANGRVVRRQAIAADDIEGLVALVRREKYDLVVVGPERPLSLGLADAVARLGVPVFGCSEAASQIETSKSFAKSLMERAGVPTARYHDFTDRHAAAEYARTLASDGDGRVVIKADGLAAGKGVELCAAPSEIDPALARLCAVPGAKVVVEEFLEGREASCMALVDGERVVSLPACEDHKTILDGDRGPMTGGMGAVCPTPVVDAALAIRIEREVLGPMAHELAMRGTPFRGLLFAGVMLTPSGPKVLEFNCRFGDPESEALLPLVDGDFAEVLLAVAQGRLSSLATGLAFRRQSSCAVVLTAPGYPGSFEKGALIEGVADAEKTGALVFHAGTRSDGARLYTDGGRVLVVTGIGADLADARAKAYGAVEKIRFPGAHHRRDIGARTPSR